MQTDAPVPLTALQLSFLLNGIGSFGLLLTYTLPHHLRHFHWPLYMGNVRARTPVTQQAQQAKRAEQEAEAAMTLAGGSPGSQWAGGRSSDAGPVISPGVMQLSEDHVMA